MVLSLVDYVLLAVVCLVIALRLAGDVRDIIEARFIKNTMRAIVKRAFSPRLTILIPLETLESTKQTLEHLRTFNLPIKVVVVIDSSVNPSSASALRYFVRKYAIRNSTVTARRNPDLMAIARENTKTGLVVVLPDTTRLHNSFYDHAILPFGDTTVDALRLASSVRIDSTLRSGIEVLYTAWRRYIGLNGIRMVNLSSEETLPPGVIMRVKHVRKMSQKNRTVMKARSPVFSVAPQRSSRLLWINLRRSVGVANYFTVLTITSIIWLLATGNHNVTFAAGTFAILYMLIAWWALGAAHISWMDRVSVVLLAPFFFVVFPGLVAAHIVQYITRVGSGIRLRPPIAREHQS